MPTSCFVLHCVASFHSAPPTLSFPLYNPPLLLLCPLSTGLRSSTCSLSFPTPFIPSQRSICASHYDTPVSINTLNCEPVHHQTLSTTTCFQQHQLTQQTHRKMKSSQILASVLFGTFAAAVPFKRDLVTKTEVVVETVIVYTTVWDDVPAAEATTTGGGYFYEVPSSSAAKTTSTSTSTSTPAYVPSPAQEPSSVYTPPAPTSASSTEVVVPSVAAPPPTSAAPPPETSSTPPAAVPTTLRLPTLLPSPTLPLPLPAPTPPALAAPALARPSPVT